MNQLVRFIPIAALIATMASCDRKDPDPQPGKPIELPCQITAGMQLTNHNTTGVDYIVNCEVEVTGGTLSIDPDVTIEFAVNTGLNIKENAAIVTAGTSDKPVIMRGNGQGNTWNGISIWSQNSTSRLSFCNILQAGRNVTFSTSLAGSIVDLKSAVTVWHRAELSNVTINGSDGVGLAVSDGAQIAVSSLNISNCTDEPILTYAGLLNSSFVLGNCTFSGNGSPFIGIYSTTSNAEVDGAVAIAKAPLPYYALRSLNFTGTAVIGAGAEIRFGQGLGLGVNENASLTINGTAADPVIIRGKNTSAAYWKGILIRSNHPDNIFTHLQIADGGSEDLGIWAGKANIAVGDKIEVSKLTLNDCTATNMAGCQVTVNQNGGTLVNNSPSITSVCAH